MAAFIGTTQALVLIFVYIVLVQVLMSSILLLGQFFVIQLRKLLAMIGEPESDSKSEQLPYRLGGGLARWE
jgi:hypothetical protein